MFANLANMDGTAYNYFAINQTLLNVNTIFVASIVSKNGETYTIQPLAKLGGESQDSIDQAQIINVPIMRVVGGDAGVIIDYEAGDVVIVGACQRDTAPLVKSNFSPSTYEPTSSRKFSLRDAIIIGKLSATPPSIHVKITKSGIDIEATDQNITVHGNNLTIKTDGNINANAGGNIVATAQGNATINGMMATLNGQVSATLAGGGNAFTVDASGGSMGGSSVPVALSTTQVKIEGVQSGGSTVYGTMVLATCANKLKAE